MLQRFSTIAVPGVVALAAAGVALAPLGGGKSAAEGSERALPGRWQSRIDAPVTDFEKAILRGEIEIR